MEILKVYCRALPLIQLMGSFTGTCGVGGFVINSNLTCIILDLCFLILFCFFVFVFLFCFFVFL